MRSLLKSAEYQKQRYVFSSAIRDIHEKDAYTKEIRRKAQTEASHQSVEEAMREIEELHKKEERRQIEEFIRKYKPDAGDYDAYSDPEHYAQMVNKGFERVCWDSGDTKFFFWMLDSKQYPEAVRQLRKDVAASGNRHYSLKASVG